MADKLYRSHSIEKSKNDNNDVITSGSLTIWEDAPISPFDVGDSFSPITNGPALTVEKVSIKDNVIGELNGKPLRQWEITIEGSNDETSSKDSQTHIKYNFNISADEKSGTMEVINTGDNPSLTLGIGDSFSVPGIGYVYCSNVKGSDDFDDNGVHSWTVVYEGSDKQEVSQETKYNFSIEKNSNSVTHSGSMQVILAGDNPSFSLQPGEEFSLPGLGKVKCSKISGSDDYNDNGIHTWTITYEGTNETVEDSTLPDIKYSFTIEKNGNSNIHTGSMTAVNEGDKPSLTISTGSQFSIPGVGAVTCTKVSGSDDFTDSGSHIWTIVYEGTDAPEEQSDEESLPETKYNLAIEKDNDGDIQKSGSMSVVQTGDAPNLDISVGSSFSIPGIGQVTCSKVTANDDYTDEGTHRWTMTYEGYVNNQSDEGDDEQDNNAKYTFSLEKDSSGNITHSGSVEITNAGKSPVFAHNVGDKLNLPGIGEVTCVKVSGSDSYTDNDKRKWTVIYEASDKLQEEESDDESSNVKYSLSIEKNSDGVTIYSGSKEFSCSGETPSIPANVGDSFTLPVIGTVTCTRIQSSNSDNDTWSVIIEGSRGGDSSSDDDSSLPEKDTTITYEINGSTVRTVAGEFIALRRSTAPIIKKSITVYTSTAGPVAIPGNTYEGGIVTSENIIHETIKSDGVVTASYYKHTIEVEA